MVRAPCGVVGLAIRDGIAEPCPVAILFFFAQEPIGFALSDMRTTTPRFGALTKAAGSPR